MPYPKAEQALIGIFTALAEKEGVVPTTDVHEWIEKLEEGIGPEATGQVVTAAVNIGNLGQNQEQARGAFTANDLEQAQLILQQFLVR